MAETTIHGRQIRPDTLPASTIPIEDMGDYFEPGIDDVEAALQDLASRMVTQSSARFEWKTNTDPTDPAHGFVKGNNATPASITNFYMSVYDKSNEAFLSINEMGAGDDFYIYEAGQVDTWNRYTLTAPPTLHGPPTEWATIPVVFVETGPNPFTPGGNTQCFVVTYTATGGGGGGGAPTGPAGGVLAGAYPNPGFAVDMATQAELDAVAAAKANTTDPRFTDARTPTGPAGGVLSGTYPSPGFAVDMATQAEQDAAVSTINGNLTTLNGNINTVNTNLNNHIANVAAAHAASAISFAPASGIVSTNVQAAIVEVKAGASTVSVAYVHRMLFLRI